MGGRAQQGRGGALQGDQRLQGLLRQGRPDHRPNPKPKPKPKPKPNPNPNRSRNPNPNQVGQIIASRQDLFPRQYTEALSGLTDLLDPMDIALVRAVVTQELLKEGETFDDVFASFDAEPLGAASVAQVPRA